MKRRRSTASLAADLIDEFMEETLESFEEFCEEVASAGPSCCFSVSQLHPAWIIPRDLEGPEPLRHSLEKIARLRSAIDGALHRHLLLCDESVALRLLPYDPPSDVLGKMEHRSVVAANRAWRNSLLSQQALLGSPDSFGDGLASGLFARSSLEVRLFVFGRAGDRGSGSGGSSEVAPGDWCRVHESVTALVEDLGERSPEFRGRVFGESGKMESGAALRNPEASISALGRTGE